MRIKTETTLWGMFDDGWKVAKDQDDFDVTILPRARKVEQRVVRFIGDKILSHEVLPIVQAT